MTFNLQRWQQTQDELAHYRRRKQFVTETLGHGEHLLQITVGDPTKVTVFDMGYDDDGQHECEITIHEEGIELDDVIAFVERDRRIVGKYDLPGPTPEEYRAMKASVERRGIWVPVIVDEAGNVIEGQVRRRIAQELGINCPSIVYRGQTAEEKLELAHELDSCRKHYSQKQKAKVVERLLRRMPTQSDRTLGRLAGVDPTTVGKYRHLLLEQKLIRESGHREGKDGKMYPVAKIATNNDRELAQAVQIAKDLPSSANGKIIDITTANRRAFRQRRKQRLSLPATPLQNAAAPSIHHCRFQNLEATGAVVAGSAQLVLTDIPYGEQFVSQLPDLAYFAERTLQEGSIFAVYVGNMWLPHSIRAFEQRLKWRWMCSSAWEGESPQVHLPGFGTVFSHHKPILIFSKGSPANHIYFQDLLLNHPKEKQWHDWQQPLSEAIKLIEDFSQPGDLVIDPLGGGFTTAAACLRTNRCCVSCDEDEQAVNNGRRRIAEELKALSENHSPSDENKSPAA